MHSNVFESKLQLKLLAFFSTFHSTHSFQKYKKYRSVLCSTYAVLCSVHTCVPYSGRTITLLFSVQWHRCWAYLVGVRNACSAAIVVHFSTVDRWSKGTNEIYYQSFIYFEKRFRVKSIRMPRAHTTSTDEHFSMLFLLMMMIFVRVLLCIRLIFNNIKFHIFFTQSIHACTLSAITYLYLGKAFCRYHIYILELFFNSIK